MKDCSGTKLWLQDLRVWLQNTGNDTRVVWMSEYFQSTSGVFLNCVQHKFAIYCQTIAREVKT